MPYHPQFFVVSHIQLQHFTSYADAEARATRLARQEPGRPYYVLQALTCVETAPNTDHTAVTQLDCLHS